MRANNHFDSHLSGMRLSTDRSWTDILGGLLHTKGRAFVILKDLSSSGNHTVALWGNNCWLGHHARGAHYLELLEEYLNHPVFKQAAAAGIIPAYGGLDVDVQPHKALDKWLESGNAVPNRGITIDLSDSQCAVNLCTNIYAGQKPTPIVSVRSRQWEWAHEALGGELSGIVDRLSRKSFKAARGVAASEARQPKLIFDINPAPEENIPSPVRLVYADPGFRKYL